MESINVNTAIPATDHNNRQQSLDQYENPYFLHSSDHAGLVPVSDRLVSGSDFHS